MANNNDINLHISANERIKWNKVIEDFANHLGANGVVNHALADGTTAGFSQANFTPAEKSKLDSVEHGANKYIHPETHDYTMITGLSTVGHTGNYNDLLNIPKTFIAGGGDADTVGGIRITVNPSAPSNPVNYKDVWFDTDDKLVRVYYNNKWNDFGGVFL